MTGKGRVLIFLKAKSSRKGPARAAGWIIAIAGATVSRTVPTWL
jgi:hypothetical protein